jgi:hypothetical protein
VALSAETPGHDHENTTCLTIQTTRNCSAHFEIAVPEGARDGGRVADRRCATAPREEGGGGGASSGGRERGRCGADNRRLGGRRVSKGSGRGSARAAHQWGATSLIRFHLAIVFFPKKYKNTFIIMDGCKTDVL